MLDPLDLELADTIDELKLYRKGLQSKLDKVDTQLRQFDAIRADLDRLKKSRMPDPDSENPLLDHLISVGADNHWFHSTRSSLIKMLKCSEYQLERWLEDAFNQGLRIWHISPGQKHGIYGTCYTLDPYLPLPVLKGW